MVPQEPIAHSTRVVVSLPLELNQRQSNVGEARQQSRRAIVGSNNGISPRHCRVCARLSSEDKEHRPIHSSRSLRALREVLYLAKIAKFAKHVRV